MTPFKLSQTIGLEINDLKPAVEDYLKFLFEEDMECKCDKPDHRYLPKDKDDWQAVSNFMAACAMFLQSNMIDVDSLMSKAICDPERLTKGDNGAELRSKMLQKSTLSSVLVAHTRYLRDAKPPCGADEYYAQLRKDVLASVERQVAEAKKLRGMPKAATELIEMLKSMPGARQVDFGDGVMAFEIGIPDKKDLN